MSHKAGVCYAPHIPNVLDYVQRGCVLEPKLHGIYWGKLRNIRSGKLPEAFDAANQGFVYFFKVAGC